MNIESAPFFTIITAVYDSSNTLPRLLKSLAEQECQDFMWIMQDGASKDDSVAIASSWQERITMCVESRADHGVYDAWNMALEKHKENLGQWILFLGADDELASPKVLQKVKEYCLALPPDTIFALGDLQVINHGQKGTYRYAQPAQAFDKLFCRMVAHPALFTRREVFITQNFDTSYRIAGDYEWLQRTWKKQEELSSLPVLTTYMWEGGLSTQNLPQVHTETLQILLKYGVKHPKDYPIYVLMLFFFATSSMRNFFCTLMEKYSWSRRILFFIQKYLRFLARQILRQKS